MNFTKKTKTTQFIQSSFNTYLNTSLIKASECGDAKSVKILLEQKADLHIENDQALRIACYRGHCEVVKILLKSKANVHAQDNEALRYASLRGDTKITKMLLDRNADIHSQDDYSLRSASYSNHVEVVKILLDYKANVDAKHGVSLQDACNNGHTEVVKSLLEHKANVHIRQYSLKYFLCQGYTEIVELLLLYGDNYRDIFDQNIDPKHIRPRKLMELFMLYQRLCQHEQTTQTHLFHRRDILQCILQF
jgi:ankyrin repeat protein